MLSVEPFFKIQGYKRFQLKLGGNHIDDIARLKACRAVMDEDEVLIGDANTGNTINV